ncbi:DUF4177 domain-containing protein [Halorussus salinus]|uniref:DUF4177 domain-containing protein n=1 Tax=Halorussus salinus TaxID=1364935 RepID=UPI0010918D24|nr:DUF4177 domain-containing protein [Halorussus salinus]
MTADTTTRWEYRVVQPPREPSKKEVRDPSGLLDEMAAEGWELDETIDYVGGGTKLLVFRRPATADAEENATDAADRSETTPEDDDE